MISVANTQSMNSSLDVSYGCPLMLKLVGFEVEDMISLANQCNGAAYGGYVRDVVINRQLGEPIKAFKDVDLWFRTSDDAFKFLKLMGNRLSESQHNCRKVDYHSYYVWNRSEYILMIDGKKIAHVDIAVSNGIPIDDYSVNKILYTGVPLDKVLKTTEVLDRYYKFLAEANREILKIHQERFESLLSRGWTVIDSRLSTIKTWQDLMQLVCNSKMKTVIPPLDINYDDKFVLKGIVAIVDEFIKKLPEGSEVFGDYKVCVTIPQEFGKQIGAFEHVDIVIPCQLDQQRFVKEMGNSLVKTNTHIKNFCQYYLLHDNLKIAVINFYQKRDFSLTGLSTNDWLTISLSFYCFELHIFDEYCEYILDADKDRLESYGKYFDKYVKMGWRIVKDGRLFDNWDTFKNYVFDTSVGPGKPGSPTSHVGPTSVSISSLSPVIEDVNATQIHELRAIKNMLGNINDTLIKFQETVLRKLEQ